MRSVLLGNYEVYSIINSAGNKKAAAEDNNKKIESDSKDKKIDRFSILLDTQIKSMS
ncbi:MAG: hypothetical protein MJ123_02290 [Lachnospiraceae bacterium]|nr:hypothetical protein [Lachnospiraceae bacterium]